jgi:Domain of unknown function (DUF4383)
MTSLSTTADASRHSDLLAVQRPFSFVQWATVLGALAVLVWSVPGIIVNPDFAVGDDATAETVLGVDMNGWHALSGFLVALPALLVASRPYLAAIYISAAAGSLIATGVWALMDTQVALGLFAFPNQEADALLHFATSLIWITGAAHYFVRERRAAA